MEKHRKTALIESHTAKIMLSIMIMLMLFTTVSALEFDNVKTYNETLNEITFINAWDLPIFGVDIAKAKLITPQENFVIAGGQIKTQIAQVNVEAFGDYDNAITKVEIEDLSTGKYVTKEIEYRYLEIYEVEMDDYQEVCRAGTIMNVTAGKISDICTAEKVGTKTIQRGRWLPFDRNIKLGNTTIGIYTNVYPGEEMEWYPTMFGVKVTEWAKYSAVNSYMNFTMDNTGDYDENTGTSAIQLSDGMDGQGNSDTAQCIDGTCFNVSASGGTVASALTETIGGWSFWINRSAGVPGGQWFSTTGITQQINGNGATMRTYCGDSDEQYNTNLLPIGVWTHVYYKGNSSTSAIYINGESIQNDGGTTNCKFLSATAENNHIFGFAGAAPMSGAGMMDEVKFYNVELTDAQIYDLYDTENGTFTGPFPGVILINPDNYYNTTNTLMQFNYSSTDDTNVTNVTLYIDGVVNTTTIWGTSNTTGTISTTLTFADGTHNWSVLAYDNVAQSNQSETREFIIDATAPIINITYPFANINDGYVNASNRLLSLNWTIVESNIDACWYYNNSENVSIACGTNATFTLPYGTYTHKVYANDTLGNDGSDTQTTTYGYNLLENSITSQGTIVQGSATNFVLNLTGDGLESVTANLIYNGTSYASTKIGDDTNMRFTNTLAPSITGTTSFFWNVSYDTTVYSSSLRMQTVGAFNVSSNCSSGSVVFNFTVKDEDTQLKLPPTTNNLTVDINLFATSLTGVQIFNYSNTFKYINSIAICTQTPLTSDIIILDGLVRYAGNGTYISEFYTIQNYSLTNTSVGNNISLYDLTTARAQEFKITYKDASFLPVVDAVLDVQRYYIGNGTYETVEQPPFDDNGETLANLVLGDVIYTLIIKKDNQVLSTFNNIKAFCDNQGTGDCEINLNALSSYVSSDSYATVDGVDLTMSYDDATRTVSTIFTTTDGTSKTLLLNVTTYDLLGNETVCSDSLTSSSGTLSCVIPGTFGNSSAMASLIINGEERAFKVISLWSSADEIYGYSTVTLSILSFLTVIGVVLGSNPVVIIVAIMIGLLVNMGLLLTSGTFVGIGSTFLWVAVVCVALLWKASRRNN